MRGVLPLKGGLGRRQCEPWKQSKSPSRPKVQAASQASSSLPSPRGRLGSSFPAGCFGGSQEGVDGTGTGEDA